LWRTVILARNTGVKDLIGKDNALCSHASGPRHRYAAAGTEGWGESDVEEIVGGLERLYSDTDSYTLVGKWRVWLLQTRTWAIMRAG